MPAKVLFVDTVGNVWERYSSGDVSEPPDPPDPFVYGVTEPYNPDPYNPPADANVGWDGTVDMTVNSDVTMPSGAYWINRRINGNVTMPSDGTGILENCLINGSAWALSKPALVRAAFGGTIRRCSIIGTPASIWYHTNGLTCTGGTMTLDRNVFWRTNDHVKVSGAGAGTAKLISTGNLYREYAFFDNDADHASDATRPYWTHNDAIQISVASSQQHVIFGDKMVSYADATGVTWSGGTWGSGTASGGYIGMPSTALNAGYWRLPYGDEVAEGIEGRCTWANGITFSNQTGHKVSIEKIWIDGVNASSGLIQFTPVGTASLPVLKGNRFGLGGKRSGSGKIYLVSYQSGTVATIGTGADANVYSDDLSVPTALRGTPLTFTAGGASITL